MLYNQFDQDDNQQIQFNNSFYQNSSKRVKPIRLKDYILQELEKRGFDKDTRKRMELIG